MTTGKRNRAKKKPEIVIQGVGASPGFARGRAIVVSDNYNSPERLGINNSEGGAVVVMRTPSCDLVIEWLEDASAIIFETGGKLCHAALICLENSKPCIVGANGLIEHLSDTTVLEVDSCTGKITIL